MEPTHNGFGINPSPEPQHTPPPTVTPLDHRLPEHGTPDPVNQNLGGLTFAVPQVAAQFSPAPASPAITPEPPKPRNSLAQSDMPDDRPVPVIRVLSVRGVEYAMMSILWWFTAGSLIWLLVSLVMGGNTFGVLAFPLSLLLISLPGFALLYIRLRKAELADPSLRYEVSKRRFSQITQILAFLTCFSNLVSLMYVIVSKIGGEGGAPLGKAIGTTFIVLAIAGGTLYYYWQDEHKSFRK